MRNKCVVTIGKFNPLHLGHKEMIVKTMAEASNICGKPIVIIIDNNKVTSDRPLTGQLRRRVIMEEFPTVEVVTSPNAYVGLQQLDHNWEISSIVCGSDRKVDYEDLVSRVVTQSQQPTVIPLIRSNETYLASTSSTKVRALVRDDNFAGYAAMTNYHSQNTTQEVFDIIKGSYG